VPASLWQDEAVFAVPVGGAWLVYAPLHGLTALVDHVARDRLARVLREGTPLPEGTLGIITQQLRSPRAGPKVRTGPFDSPSLLGIVPTRACSLGCGYCDFAPRARAPEMSRDLAEAAVDAYLAVVAGRGERQGHIHFFGGEPFHAPLVVEHVVEYATSRAGSAGIGLHFEVTSNGMVSEARARWIAKNLDAVVLSLDGPPEVQDLQRPLRTGAPSSEVVLRTARILAQGPVELIVRSCVTAATVERLAEWALWLSGSLRPSAVCFEGLTSSAPSLASGHQPPDPYVFARGFVRALEILRDAGIRAVHSTSEEAAPRISMCPLGRDAMIVEPDGSVVGCYLPPERWRSRPLDLGFGRIDVERRRAVVDPGRLAHVRGLPAQNDVACAVCFCRFHCAGGCRVERILRGDGRDGLCLTTRLLSAHRLLRGLGLDETADQCVGDGDCAAAIAGQPDDRLSSVS
jgi:uncharacterized protein